MSIADKTALLASAPEMEAYRGRIVVIKYGGNAMVNGELKQAVLEDVAALQRAGMKVVLSHGGGPDIDRMLKALAIPVRFVDGLRYTSEEVLRVVEMVLIGQVNTELVARLGTLGVKAVGLSGVSGGLYRCHRRSEALGLVGDIEAVDPTAIHALLDAGCVPVIAPLGVDGAGQIYNINGDTAAGMLAAALGAEKLVLLTDIEGVCNDIKKRDVISYLHIDDIPALREKGTIAGGMIPKAECCAAAVRGGVTSVHIIDGRKKHAIVTDVFTGSGGTTVGVEKPSVGIQW